MTASAEPTTTYLAPTAETVADREAIRQAMARYCRGVDRLDVDLIKSAYHPDAFDDHGPFKGLRDDFVAWVVPFMRREYVTTSHHLTTQSIEVQGDVAYAETYAVVVQEKHVGEEVLQLVANSRYVDRFERRDGDWRIAHRVVVTDSARTDTVAPWKGTSPISSMTRGTRDHSDPVYRR
jgi:ketosteroid isomerase-like protein